MPKLGITKKEMIEALNLDVQLFTKTETKSSIEGLYISKLEFIEIGKVIKSLKNLEKERVKYIDQIRKIIDTEDRFMVLKNTKMFINDKIINVPLPLIVLDGDNIISNNVFNNKTNG